MGNPLRREPRYKRPVTSPTDPIYGARSTRTRAKQRSARRRATRGPLEKAWYDPHHPNLGIRSLGLIVGFVIVVVLLVSQGLVAGALCVQSVGCIASTERGVELGPERSVLVRAP